MKLILALRDSKAEMFLQPFFVPTLGVAYRNLQDEIQRGGDDNTLARHAEDYELWELGTFDDENGEVLQGDGWPKLLCEVSTLVVKAN